MADFSCASTKRTSQKGSNELGSARALPRLCRGRSACPHRLQRQSGGQSLVADGLPVFSPATTWGLQSLQSHQLRTEQHRARRALRASLPSLCFSPLEDAERPVLVATFPAPSRFSI